MRKKIKAIFWDMDGTLFETRPGIEAAVKETLEYKGLPALAPGVIENFIGPPIQYGFRDICGLPEEEAVDAANFFRKIYREKGYVELCDPYEGLFDTLDKLYADGFLLGVCTLKKQDMAERIVRKHKIGHLFSSIVGTDALDNIKKDDTIRMSCDHLCLAVDEAVLIGDTDFDSIGADKAGSLFIGVTYGYGFKTAKDVDEYPNIGTADKPAEVYELVSAYNSELS